MPDLAKALSFLTDADMNATASGFAPAAASTSTTTTAAAGQGDGSGSEGDAGAGETTESSQGTEAASTVAAETQTADGSKAAAPAAQGTAAAPAAKTPDLGQLAGWQSQLEQRSVQLNQMAERLDQQTKSLEPVLRLQERLGKVKEDPRVAFEVLRTFVPDLDYGKLSAAFAKDPPPPAEVLETRSEMAKLRNEVQQWQAQAALSAEAGKAGQVLAGAKYGLCRRIGGVTPEMLAKVREAYAKKGQPVTYEQLLDEHEAALEKEVAASSKFVPAPAGDKKPPAPSLNNRAAGEPAEKRQRPRTEAERREAALSMMGDDYAKGWNG